MKKKLSKLEKKIIKEVMKTNLTLFEKGIVAHQIVFSNFKEMTK